MEYQDSDRIRSKAKELRLAGQVDEALPLFEALWASPDRSEWDGWGRAFCLRKLGRPRDASRACREVEEFDSDFGPVYGLHAWCLYDQHLRDTSGARSATLVDVLEAVGKCADKTGEPYGRYSALVPAVFAVVKAFKDPYRPSETLEALDHLDPMQLSADFETIHVGGRSQTILSKRERWFHSRTKALEELERWPECADSSVRALDSVPSFRGEGLMWIERRLALALLNSGDAANSAELLRDVLRRKDLWFLHDDLAQAELALENTDEARRQLVLALRTTGPKEMKVGTLRRMAVVEETLGNLDSACAHADLAKGIRDSKDWSDDKQLEALMKRLGCTAGTTESAPKWSAVSGYW